MAKLKCVFFVLSVCLFKNVVSTVLCEAGFCRTYILDVGCQEPAAHCSINNATHSGMSLPSPTICNCCDYCLPFILENAPCSLGGPGVGTTVGRCGPGLTCAQGDNGNHVCTRMKTECHDAQDDYDARHLIGETGVLEERPECDGKGKYSTVSCVPGQTCFCQTEDEDRIFGEMPYTATFSVPKSSLCGCSRMHEKIKKDIGPAVRFPVIGPRCTSDGRFHPIQCVENLCYCVNRVTGVRTGDDQIYLLNEPVTKLDCYDPELDLAPQNSVGERPYKYSTLCLDNIQKRINLTEESEKAGYNVNHGNGFPDCLPDGSFGRIATTQNRSKICVDDRRQKIGKYEAFEENTLEYESMDCKCAQTESLMGSSLELPVCCKNGNFRRIQCRRGLCRCVDSDGRQVGKENSDVTKLDCYTPTWRTC